VNVLCAVVALISLSGCKRPNPEPEKMDAIYRDLSESAKAWAEESSKRKEELKLAREELLKAPPNTLDKKDVEKRIAKLLPAVREAEQMSRYFDIRVRRRQVEARASYAKAFAADKPWPDPSEYSGYSVNKRLREANLNWNTRVPKLADRVASSEPGKKEAEKGSH
jgi:hypothetical protein